MAEYKLSKVPRTGEPITFADGKLSVPARPIVPFVEGDGTGPDIWRASVRVFDAAVEKAYGGERKVEWMEAYAGEKAFKQFNCSAPFNPPPIFEATQDGFSSPASRGRIKEGA